MPRTVFAAAALIMTAGLIWPLRLLFYDTPWEPVPTFLIASDLVVLSTIAVVAMLLSPSRWVRVTLTLLGGIWLLMAVLTTINWSWAVGLSSGGAGLVLAWSIRADAWFHTFKPDRVPVGATILTLGMVALPGLVGVLAWPDMTAGGWILAGAATVGAWAYARALPVILWLIRLGLPLLGATAAIGLHPATGASLIAVCLGLAGLAWGKDARLAVEQAHPRKVAAVPILPEMVPSHFLESSGFDSRGRPSSPESPSKDQSS